MRSRDELLKLAASQPERQVLIVGGGINGVGLLRDLAAQGVGALLVERGDFCSGTSAAPSRLIHGGLRYLETGEFSLLRESVEERNRLLQNAPHLVVPIPVWIPLQSFWAGLARAPARFFGWTRNPGPKGALVTKLGLLFYDWFGRKNTGVPRHRMVGGPSLRRAMPSIAPGVKLAAEFYDARLLHPERLALELVADAERNCPDAMALPYVEFAAQEGAEVLLRDTLSGHSFKIRPGLVVNTAGAWVDRVNERMGLQQRLVGGTRGSHLVLRHAALARELGPQMLYFETVDHRFCLAYGLTDDLVLLGTTDIRTDNPDDAHCTEAEMAYLFAVFHEAMPGIQLSREQIVFSYAGVRPLPAETAESGVAAGAVSRDHTVQVRPAQGPRPYDILTLVGGKWTTYRSCAAYIADMVLTRLKQERKIDTATLRIGSARDWPKNAQELAARIRAVCIASGLAQEDAQRLWERFGNTALEVAAVVAQTHQQRINGLPDYTVGEIVFMARQQRVTRLTDVLLRRTLLALEGRCSTVALQAICDVLGDTLGWDAIRRAAEIQTASALLQNRHGVSSLGPKLA